MLVCVIAIPLAALLGTRLPELVSRVLSERLELPLLSARDSPSEAPAFGPAAPAAQRNGLPNSAIWGGRQAGLHPPSWWRSGASGTTASASGATSPLGGGHVGGLGSAGQAQPPAVGPSHPIGEGDAILASYDAPVEPAPASTAVAADPTTPPASLSLLVPVAPSDRVPVPTGDQLAHLERRLRELGATYYLLETWGTHGQYYRFQARMAVGGQADRVRHFEATHSDPQQAMAKVLEQVDSWRAGR